MLEWSNKLKFGLKSGPLLGVVGLTPAVGKSQRRKTGAFNQTWTLNVFLTEILGRKKLNLFTRLIVFTTQKNQNQYQGSYLSIHINQFFFL